MTKDFKVSVVGAGCGGQAISGHIASLGYKVKLYNRSEERITDLRKDLRIRLEGENNAIGLLDKVTTNLEEAIEDTKLIMVVTTATGHRELAEKMSPYLQDGQVILLNPGRSFGSLEMWNIFKKNNVDKDITVAEANTLIYATRLETTGYSLIKGVKNEVQISSIPTGNIDRVLEYMHDIYPQFTAANNFLETSLGNLGPIFHPTITLMNEDRIRAKENFNFYTDAINDQVAGYIEKVDEERITVARSLFQTNIPDVKEWLTSRYDIPGSKEKNLTELLKTNPAYQNLSAPTTMNVRYLWEDVPTGLVPFSCIGKALGIPTPYTDYLIRKSSEILGKDFYMLGRNLKNLGLNPDNLKQQIGLILQEDSFKERKDNTLLSVSYPVNDYDKSLVQAGDLKL